MRRTLAVVAFAALVAVGPTPVPGGVAPTELFISEYIEGNSNNKDEAAPGPLVYRSGKQSKRGRTHAR